MIENKYFEVTQEISSLGIETFTSILCLLLVVASVSISKKKRTKCKEPKLQAFFFSSECLPLWLGSLGRGVSWKGPTLIAGHPCDSYREEEFNSTNIHWVPIVCWSLYRVPAVQSCIIMTPDLKKFLNLIEETDIIQVVNTMWWMSVITERGFKFSRSTKIGAIQSGASQKVFWKRTHLITLMQDSG